MKKNRENYANMADKNANVEIAEVHVSVNTNNSTWCETHANSKYDGYCFFCYVNLFPDEPICRNYKTKEKCVVDFITSEFPNFTWFHDKRVKDGCSKRRPDLLLHMGSHAIIVEIDENQHTDYDSICENKRLMELSQDLNHIPVVFIRFNPDDYVKNGNKIKSCWKVHKNTGIIQIDKNKKNEWKERLENLKNTIHRWTKTMTTKMIEIVKLYYDEK